MKTLSYTHLHFHVYVFSFLDELIDQILDTSNTGDSLWLRVTIYEVWFFPFPKKKKIMWRKILCLQMKNITCKILPAYNFFEKYHVVLLTVTYDGINNASFPNFRKYRHSIAELKSLKIMINMIIMFSFSYIYPSVFKTTEDCS